MILNVVIIISTIHLFFLMSLLWNINTPGHFISYLYSDTKCWYPRWNTGLTELGRDNWCSSAYGTPLVSSSVLSPILEVSRLRQNHQLKTTFHFKIFVISSFKSNPLKNNKQPLMRKLLVLHHHHYPEIIKFHKCFDQ